MPESNSEAIVSSLRLTHPKHTKADFIFYIKNPEEKLEQLQRSSLLEFEHLMAPDHPVAPLRELPEHSVPIESTATRHSITPSHDGTTDAKRTELGLKEPSISADAPIFKDPDFGSKNTNGGETGPTVPTEDALSPTETRR